LVTAVPAAADGDAAAAAAAAEGDDGQMLVLLLLRVMETLLLPSLLSMALDASGGNRQELKCSAIFYSFYSSLSYIHHIHFLP
jgi:hypothetical protein